MSKPLLKEDEVPSGGIADFIMSPDEIKQIEALEAREQFGGSGIANFEEVASRMASYGRFGDDTVAHLQKGEVIVPRALIEQNPKLKESIFDHLRKLGIEDPERYVVGSSANSINPDTGMPEFFLGKILKGVGKIFKKVGKVLKKAAPAIGAILLTPVLGPIYGAALGSGIGTLIQGGSAKDALKSALFAGVTGGITTGMTGGMESLGTALNPSAMLQQAGTFGKAFLKNPIDAYLKGTYVPKGKSIFGGKEAVDSTNLIEKGGFDFSNIPERSVSTMTEQAKTLADSTMTPKLPFLKQPTSEQYKTAGNLLKDTFFPAGPTDAAINAKVAELKTLPEFAKLTQSELVKTATEKLTPSFLRQYGPLALAGTGVMAAAGMFDAPKDEEIQYETGKQLLEKDPEKYTPDSSAYALNYLDPSLFGIPNQYYSANLQMQNPLVQSVKDGGEIFPRRTGGIDPDEGVAGKDSVRAMLMPGEFVMTTKAVKGMGNGNLDQGINKMYDMMRNLEGRERMMA
jgi:hypothetical protein|tara:strand:- start:243 stop:1784 length:1542 start_codon:yes stop_codon:yes gene_type:complete